MTCYSTSLHYYCEMLKPEKEDPCRVEILYLTLDTDSGTESGVLKYLTYLA